MVSLKQKLIFRNTAIMSTLFALVMAVFIFLSFRSYAAQINQTRITIEENKNENYLQLAQNMAFLLRVYVEDNSYGTVRYQFRQFVKANKDVVFGSFISTLDEGDYSPWVWVTPENPEGVELDVMSDEEKRQLLNTDTMRWAFQQEEPTFRKVVKSDEVVYEYTAAVYIQPDPELPPNKLGYVIFTITNRIWEKKLKEDLNNRRKEFFSTAVILLIFGAVTLFLGIAATRDQAIKITQPLGILTSAADTIASGQYDVMVEVRSGDEIEVLASSFNKMAKDLDASYSNIYTKNRELEEARHQLEDLNKHLEEKVEQRTKQLSESERKFRTLFEESADAILLSHGDCFLDCNPAMLSMMGCESKEKMLTLDQVDIFPPQQRDGSDSKTKFDHILEKARTSGSQQFEYLNRRLNGELFHTEIVITYFTISQEDVYHIVFRDITERKRTEEALRQAQQRLVETAHSAGMAEIATGVLHNIGNILNSVNISTEEMSQTLKNSKIKGFVKANDMLRQHQSDLNVFLVDHPKGRLIPGYFISLGDAMAEEHKLLSDEIDALTSKVSVMRDVISTQQNYAKAGLYTEDAAISELIDDAMKLQIASLHKQGVKVIDHIDRNIRGSVAKVKLIHVLTNLVKNAREAMQDNDKNNKPQILEVGLTKDENDWILITIRDNGCGIDQEHMEKIFNHGFTTKDDGHGFGLHTCANFLTEMGGALTATSEGLGMGACFTLHFPVAPS